MPPSPPPGRSYPAYIRLTAACLLAGALIAPAPAHAAPALNQLAARLEQAAVIHAEYTQTKTLQALKRPLRTTGQLVFARGQGVLWRIDKPYQATYALNAERVTEIAPDGGRKTRQAKDVPALAQVGRVFQAIFQGDLGELEQHFLVAVSGDAEAWRVDLAPKPALARFIRGIRASGGRYLDRIEVEEGQGDLTRIQFQNTRTDLPLTPAEAALLSD